MLQRIEKIWSEKGQGIVEYALILAFVVAIAIERSMYFKAKDPGRSFARKFADMLSQSAYAVVCAALWNTAVRVVDKSTLEQLVSVVVVQVVYHPVPELGCKDLPLFRTLYDEARRRSWLIRPVP